MKLQTKIWFWMAGLMLASLLVSLAFSYQKLERYVEEGAQREALNLRATLMSVRRVYHQQFINSGVELTDKTLGFLPAHALTQISADLKSRGVSGLTFNHVSDRPRNPLNQADADELRAIEWFRAHPQETEFKQEIGSAQGDRYFHFTSPIWIEAYCLQCHGRRDRAPEAIRRLYDQGYNYEVGDLRGVISIKVPLHTIRERTLQLWLGDFFNQILGFGAVFVMLGWLISRQIAQRLERLETKARDFAAGNFSTRSEEASTDEIGTLASSFNQMAGTIEQRDRSLNRLVSELQRNTAQLEAERSLLERRVAERTSELLNAKEAADQASRAKSEFVASMSHEIRTPMNAIVGLTHLLKKQAGDAETRHKLAQITQSADHLLDVINNILDISKIEAGKLQIEQREFNARTMLVDAIDSLAEKAGASHLELIRELDPALDHSFLGAPLQLKQIVLNLLSNALKFTPAGSITVKAAVTSESAALSWIRIEVIDTGIGIAPAAKARLFQSFEQGDESTARKFGGTGLGLAICRRLTELMGGQIGVDSELGVGSRFWCSIPLVRLQGAPIRPSADATPRSAEETLRRRFGHVRLLIAEDNAINLEVTLEILGDLGWRIDAARNGREAVTLAERMAYDLIVMDMEMPEMNGIEATQRIRRLPRHALTPIIAMTANAFEEDRQLCLRAGMSDHIGKPVDPEQFYDLLLRWLESRRPPGTAGTGNRAGESGEQAP